MAEKKFDVKNVPVQKLISPSLLPFEKREALYFEVVGETVRRVSQIGLILLLCFFSFGLFTLLNLQKQEKSFASKYEKIDTEKLSQLNKIKKEVQETNSVGNSINQKIQKQYQWNSLLAKLSEVTPEGVILVSIETPLNNPSWITIIGVAKERDLFLKFKSGLENTGLFEKIESPLSNYVDPQSLEFELNAQVKSWKPKWAQDAKKAKLEARKQSSESE